MTLVLQLLLQALDVGAQAGVFAIEVLGMATGAGEACDAVCCTTFGVVLGAGRAAAGLGVAADLSCLREGRRMSVGGGGGGTVRAGCSCVCMYICMYAYIKCVTRYGIERRRRRRTLLTHLAPVACLTRAIRDALFPGARLLLLLVLLLCGMLVMRVVVLVLRMLVLLVLVLVLFLVLVLRQVVSRGLDCRHVLQLGTRSTAIVVVVDGSLDRHGGSARLVVLRRLLSQKSSVFSVSLSRVLSSPRQWRPAG